jgi:hypothetical protein
MLGAIRLSILRSAKTFRRKTLLVRRFPRLGAGASPKDVNLATAVKAMAKVKGSRWYALDDNAKLQLAALASATGKHGADLVSLLAQLATILPGWLQERPPPGAVTIAQDPKILGVGVGRPQRLLPRATKRAPHNLFGCSGVRSPPSHFVKWPLRTLTRRSIA